MSNELIQLVANSKKKTIVKAYLKSEKKWKNVYDKIYIGTKDELDSFLSDHEFEDVFVETLSMKSALGLEDISRFQARIEQGALIRKGAYIEENAVVLMGAVININALIGSETMIDMNAVIGSGARIGKRCHIGAGAVIAGMMEPAGKIPVVIEDDVFIGANAVILEEVTIGHHSIIGAGAVVTKNVEPYSVMVGVPARIIKENNHESFIESSLRNS